jgi:hypothetical protein
MVVLLREHQDSALEVTKENSSCVARCLLRLLPLPISLSQIPPPSPRLFPFSLHPALSSCGLAAVAMQHLGQLPIKITPGRLHDIPGFKGVGTRAQNGLP